MDCPFYLVVATKKHEGMMISSRISIPSFVSHVFTEIDANEVDISDKGCRDGNVVSP
jgi:hypothetical protein